MSLHFLELFDRLLSLSLSCLPGLWQLVPVVGRLPHLTAAVAVQGMWEQGSPDRLAGVQAGVQAGEGKGPEGEGKQGLEGQGRREMAERKKETKWQRGVVNFLARLWTGVMTFLKILYNQQTWNEGLGT